MALIVAWVLAGPGGNGGGGLVAARHLAPAGAQVEVALAATVDALAAVPAEQLEIARRLRIPIHRRLGRLGGPELVLDALLGYSQRGDPHGTAAELIRWSSARCVLALDAPPGSSSPPGGLRRPPRRRRSDDDARSTQGPGDVGAANAVGDCASPTSPCPHASTRSSALSWRTPFRRGPLVELRIRR